MFVHYTNSYEALKEIFKNGFVPKFQLKFAHFCDQKEKDDYSHYIWNVFPIISFLNIKLLEIPQHTKNYGEFGMIMNEHWIQKNDIDSMIYFSPKSRLALLMETYANEWQTTFDSDFECWRKSFRLQPYLKNHKGKIVANEIDEQHNNHKENEWIYVPPFEYYNEKGESDYNEIEPDDHTEEKIKEANKKISNYKLKFQHGDVRYILLKNYNDVLPFVRFLEKELGKKASRFIPKIITLEQLHEDF